MIRLPSRSVLWPLPPYSMLRQTHPVPDDLAGPRHHLRTIAVPSRRRRTIGAPRPRTHSCALSRLAPSLPQQALFKGMVIAKQQVRHMMNERELLIDLIDLIDMIDVIDVIDLIDLIDLIGRCPTW